MAKPHPSSIRHTQEVGQTPVTDDFSLSADGNLDLGQPVYIVDVYNGGSSTLTIAAGGITRRVPAGTGRLCEFDAESQTFAVTCSGESIFTGME